MKFDVLSRRSSLCRSPHRGCVCFPPLCVQEREGLFYHYWALFDGHAGSGVAIMASRLLHHHLAGHLQPVVDVLHGPRAAPIVLGEELNPPPLEPGSARSLCRATSLRGAAGAPGGQAGAPCCTPPPRYFMEKKIQHESLVVGALENAFKEMVRGE